MKTATFRLDNVKVDGDLRQTLREVSRRWPDSREGRRAQSVLAKGQRHIPAREAHTYLALLGAV